MSKCIKCNKEILENQLYCPNCGTKQTREWYYIQNNEPVGPYTEEELVNLYNSKTIQQETFVWYEGLEEWVSLDKSGLPIQIEEIKEEVKEPQSEPVEDLGSDEVINGWFVAGEDGPLGPYTEEEMINFIEKKEVKEESFIWSEGLNDWVSVKESDFSSYLPKVEEEVKEWYYAKGDNNIGPLSYSELMSVFKDGQITSEDYIWKQGWTNWEVAGQTEFSNLCVQPKVSPQVQMNTQAAPVEKKKSKKGLLFILAAAILLSVGGGAYVAYQNKVNAELKQAEEAKAKKEAEKKKQEEEKKKAEEEAKKKEEQEKKEEEAKKLAEEKAKQAEEAKKKENATTYVVRSDVVNGVYLHTEPDKLDTSNRRGLLMPGDTAQITEVIKNEDCTWGKTDTGMYVCIYESWSDEDKEVGTYMSPVQ